MLNEQALRSANFNEAQSVPVKLGDGQDWFLRRRDPVHMRPIVSGGKFVRMTIETAYGRELGETIDRMESALSAIGTPDGSVETGVTLAMEVVATVLGRSYDLPDDAYEALLPWIPDDEANTEMWRNALDVIRGLVTPADAQLSV